MCVGGLFAGGQTIKYNPLKTSNTIKVKMHFKKVPTMVTQKRHAKNKDDRIALHSTCINTLEEEY